jgi:DNA helicase-2/ATP-dependent DNA helicase PcrA
MEAGTLDLLELLGLTHLIIDEFQDLNPMDLRFVHKLAEEGAKLFVAGDDDQSLYAFRYASPEGIEQFSDERPGCGDHMLSDCFRCTRAILDAAQSLIRAHATENRLEKNLISLWEGADPTVPGGFGCWNFASGVSEARSIAQSCLRLIEAGMNPRDIMILVASTTHPTREVQQALEEVGAPFSPVREEDIIDTDAGRAGYAALSIVIDPMNYVAHRTLLGVQHGVGAGTCNAIARAVIDNQRNFRELFYSEIPRGLLTARAQRAVSSAADICAELAVWSEGETLGERRDDLCSLVNRIRGDADAAEPLDSFLSDLPAEMTLQEAHSYLAARHDDDRRKVLEKLMQRLSLQEVDTSLVPDRIQVLTMHSAKGLSAQVVFIPGLEQSILPGAKRAPYPGLVREAARMLYVSITRARVACAVSFGRTRVVNGQMTSQTPSEFAAHLGKPFERRGADGISIEMAERIVASTRAML